MIQLTKKFLLAACSVAGLLTLGGCGGSDDPAPPGLAQTITFESPGEQNLLQPTVALVATATSGLPVVFGSTPPSVCTVDGTTLTLVSVGDCTVGAAQLGDATFAKAEPVLRTFTVVVRRTAQTITFASPGDQTFGVAPAPLVATSDSGLTVAFASITPEVCTVDVGTTTLTLVKAGETCTVEASQAGSLTVLPAQTVSNSFQVVQGTQSIEFISPGDQTLSSTPVALTATATSDLPVFFESTTTTPTVCTVSGTTLRLEAAGSCTVNASQAGNANWTAAPTVSKTFMVSAAPLTPQTITFNPIGDQIVGTPATLVATASSTLTPVIFTTNTATCTVSVNTLTPVSPGPCNVFANQAGGSGFAAAPQVLQTITVAAAPAPINGLANGGFEDGQTTTPSINGPVPNVDPTKAQAWIPAQNGYVRSADARTGSFSALVRQTQSDAAGIMLQNSKSDGYLPNLTPGASLTLSFWAKSSVAEAVSFYNFSYALRFLNDDGNILGGSGVVQFSGQTNNTTWSPITSGPFVVPAGATAAFFEISVAGGGRLAAVLIDDVTLATP